MLNDRDMHDDHEDSEYHFSDEDVSYEVETESDSLKSSSAPAKESALNRVSHSKRMLISFGIFLGLVFIVYKMVTPSAGPVATDITSPVTTAKQNKKPTQQPMAPQQASVPAVAQNVPPPAAKPQPAVQPPPVQDTTPAVEVAVNPPPVPAAPAVAPMTQPESTPAPVPAPASSQQAVASMPPVIAVQPPVQTSVPADNNAAYYPPAAPMVANQQPVQTQYDYQQAQPMPVSGQNGAMSPIDAAAARLAEANERLMAQLQSDYTQRISDYVAQNKQLQDQMQTLTNRVSTMEAQISQLVQALTPQRGSQPQSSLAPGSLAPPEKPVMTPAEIKSAYSVQAIIPGRAWLRSEAGEAVTVAEGDTIKDLGRVTKIDPYDGIVEVNTGNKTLTLSYGNGNE